MDRWAISSRNGRRVSALAFCHKRFEGQDAKYHDEKSGGIGCFTPDAFPVFDLFRDNCYVIADSNHGYKMIGVGELVAQEILGSPSALLEPFRISRYAEGRLHPVSSSPFPWSWGGGGALFHAALDAGFVDDLRAATPRRLGTRGCRLQATDRQGARPPRRAIAAETPSQGDASAASVKFALIRNFRHPGTKPIDG